MSIELTSRTPAYLLFSLLLGVFLTSWGEETAESYMTKAQEAFDRSDIVASMSWYRKAAELGHAPAQARLAYLLDNTELNEEAVAWYRLAAEQGDAEGEFGLAQMYASGEGVEKDNVQAVELFTRAANQGHRQSIQVLAAAYEQGGLGLQVSYDKAVTWLNVGVEAGDPWAVKRLAKAYRIGELGLRYDPEQAQALEQKLQNADKQTATE